jgi:methionine salvage enolase-phosphatase E1
VYPSHVYRDRKPNLSFFWRVIDQIGASTCQILFIYDEIANVVAAGSMGIRSLLADKDNINPSLQLLYNLCNADLCVARVWYNCGVMPVNIYRSHPKDVKSKKIFRNCYYSK